MAVLVGCSSTGKIRACWEVVHLLPQGWRLWHPFDPTRPEAVLAERRSPSWVRSQRARKIGHLGTRVMQTAGH